MIIQNASDLKIARLYHYQPCNMDWMRQIILDRKIQFSNPRDFNDPWDCRPYFYIPEADDQRACERCVQWFDAAARKQAPGLDEQEHARKIIQLRNNRPSFERFIRDLSESIIEAINKIYRVYCLSTKPDSTLVWSHYSNNHQGVCLEFACNNIVFGSATQIQYSEEYPPLDFAIDAQDRLGLLPLFVKSDAWSYEDEYRVIAQEVFELPRTTILRTRKNFLKYPPGALRAIIMGCMIPQSDAAELRRIIDQQFPPHVALKRAVRTPNRYDLSILMC
jgi:DUF2971 family protein